MEESQAAESRAIAVLTVGWVSYLRRQIDLIAENDEPLAHAQRGHRLQHYSSRGAHVFAVLLENLSSRFARGCTTKDRQIKVESQDTAPARGRRGNSLWDSCAALPCLHLRAAVCLYQSAIAMQGGLKPVSAKSFRLRCSTCRDATRGTGRHLENLHWA